MLLVSSGRGLNSSNKGASSSAWCRSVSGVETGASDKPVSVAGVARVGEFCIGSAWVDLAAVADFVSKLIGLAFAAAFRALSPTM
jgi:hypothetical protein